MHQTWNVSGVMAFTLSGFTELLTHRAAIFCVALLCYCVILFLNVLLVLVIACDHHLHHPMYLLVCVCCLNSLYGATGFYPKFLCDLLSPRQVVSYHGCLVQAFVMYSGACSGTSVMAVMAYDRYVAICHPLRYHSVMTGSRLVLLVSVSWLTPSCLFIVSILLTSRLSFCRSDIRRLFCVNWLMVELACPNMDTTANNAFGLATVCIYVGHWFFILWTYLHLLHTCLWSREDRTKFMQTCLPNLVSLVAYFVLRMTELMDRRFSSRDLSPVFQNFASVATVVIPPVLNPLLYGFKLNRIRSRILAFTRLRPVSLVPVRPVPGVKVLMKPDRTRH